MPAILHRSHSSRIAKSIAASSMILSLFVLGLHPSLAEEATLGRINVPNIEQTTRIVEMFEDSSRVAIVGFETELWVGVSFPNGKEVIITRPRTGIFPVESGTKGVRDVLRVKGRFVLIKGLYGTPISGGAIDEKIVFKFRRAEFDKRYWQLKNLTATNAKEPSKLYLVVWPQNARRMLDGAFFGPIPKGDLHQLQQVTKYLIKTRVPKIERKDAEMLLTSSNPWKIYLGLTRLYSLGKLRAHHFATALRSLPKNRLRTAVVDMLQVNRVPQEYREGLKKEFLTFFSDLNQDKQVEILSTLNLYLPGQYYQDLLDLPALQNAARKYRRQIENDPARREVLREIDALLKIRGKVIAS